LLTADASGQQVYTTVCQGCHMADGKGAGRRAHSGAGGQPQCGNAAICGDDGAEGRGAMPSFAGLLNDRQIALVANFVGGNLGNKYKASIKPEDVKATRDLLHKQ
jgi:mono/diheme cytochrome c family protein